MRLNSWAFWFAAPIALIAVPASSSPNSPRGPWRLIQLFEPVPGPQRGIDVWALESDLHPAAKGRKPAVTTLTFNQDERTGQLRTTAYYTSEYNCSSGETRT